MVQGTSHMALGGPPLVKAAVGEDVTAEEMGGSAVHTKVSGVADLEVADDRECLRRGPAYLGFFPSRTWRRRRSPPSRPTRPTAGARTCYDIVPANPRQAYDIRKVIRAIADDGDVLPHEARLGPEPGDRGSRGSAGGRRGSWRTSRCSWAARST